MTIGRQLILHIATSSDGFISTKTDGLEWLPQSSETEDYGMGTFMQTVDCVLIGRRTWDIISQFEGEQFAEFDRHILSRTSHDAVDFIGELKMKSGKNIWLIGGGLLNEECLRADLIDKIVITQIPIELGEGIPVFGRLGVRLPNSWLKESEIEFSEGIIQTTWKPVMGTN